MKEMLIFLSSLFLMFSFVACNNHHNLPALEECPYEMKGPLTIQDPFVDSTTYTVTVPKEYTAGCIGSHTLHAKSPDYVDDSDAFTNLLQVIDYSIYGLYPVDTKVLFSSEYEEYLDAFKEDYARRGTPAFDFSYELLQGSHGRMAQVKFSYISSGKQYTSVYCYREDIPFLAYGEINDENPLSSGQYVPWVIDSFEINE